MQGRGTGHKEEARQGGSKKVRGLKTLICEGNVSFKKPYCSQTGFIILSKNPSGFKHGLILRLLHFDGFRVRKITAKKLQVGHQQHKWLLIHRGDLSVHTVKWLNQVHSKPLDKNKHLIFYYIVSEVGKEKGAAHNLWRNLWNVFWKNHRFVFIHQTCLASEEHLSVKVKSCLNDALLLIETPPTVTVGGNVWMSECRSYPLCISVFKGPRKCSIEFGVMWIWCVLTLTSTNQSRSLLCCGSITAGHFYSFRKKSCLHYHRANEQAIPNSQV